MWWWWWCGRCFVLVCESLIQVGDEVCYNTHMATREPPSRAHLHPLSQSAVPLREKLFRSPAPTEFTVFSPQLDLADHFDRHETLLARLLIWLNPRSVCSMYVLETSPVYVHRVKNQKQRIVPAGELLLQTRLNPSLNPAPAYIKVYTAVEESPGCACVCMQLFTCRTRVLIGSILY